MDAGQALLRKIVEDPTDIASRLIFADWLEENAETALCPECRGVPRPECRGVPRTDKGHAYFWQCPKCDGTGRASDGRAERAEFIRVQCELAQLPDCFGEHALPRCDQVPLEPADWCRPCLLRRRERELWGDFDSGLGRRLLYELPGTLREQVWSVALRDCFRCGFVEAVAACAASWLAHGPALVAQQPVMRVTLLGTAPEPFNRRYIWYRRHALYTEVTRSVLPDELFDALPGASAHAPTVMGLILTRSYDRKADALDALSTAAVQWARARAGLPPLPAPVVS